MAPGVPLRSRREDRPGGLTLEGASLLQYLRNGRDNGACGSLAIYLVLTILFSSAAPAVAQARNGGIPALQSEASSDGWIQVEKLDLGPPLDQERTLASRIRDKSGGYGFLTPILIALTSAVDSFKHRESDAVVDTAADAFGFVGEKRFWGGLGADLLVTAVAGTIASAMPGGPFLQTLLPVAGGFLGWQIGTGQLGNTDWVGLGAQIGAAAVTQYAVIAMMGGMPGSRIVAGLASAVTGITMGILMDSIRDRYAMRAEATRPSDLPLRDAVKGPMAAWGPSEPEPSAQKRYYRRLLEALSAGDRERIRMLHDAYRGGDPAPAW